MKRCLLVALLTLTHLFFGSQNAFSQPDTHIRGNAAHEEALSEELKDLDIKDYFIAASEAEPVGFIQTVTGHVVVLHGDTNEAYFAAEGDRIFQQDVFFTLEDSRCRIKLSTEDVITMAEDSQVGIDEFIDDRDMEKKESTISMLKGKAMFYVVPLFRYKEVSTSVETPTAVCGVRGTKFGVGVKEDTQTVVYGFEGDVEVYSPVDGTSQMVGEGESLQMTGVGAGDVQDMSLGMAEQFMTDTEAPAPEEKDVGSSDQAVEEQAGASEEEQGVSEEEGSTEEGAGEDEESDDGKEGPKKKMPGPGGQAPKEKENGPYLPPVLGPEAPFPTDPHDPDLPPPIEPESPNPDDPSDQWPIKHHGYFSGMLTKVDGTKTFKHLYLSDQRQDLDLSSATARDKVDYPSTPIRFLYVDGGNGYDTDPKITGLQAGADDVVGDTIVPSEFPFTIQHGDIGHNAYMEWGWWLQTLPMPGSSTAEYMFDNRGYYVFGDYTTASLSDIAQTIATGTYTGEAHGTYWTSNLGENMSGDFSADVNVTSATISNFRVDVWGPIHKVLIDGASGSFTSGSAFKINPDGTWKIGEISTLYDADTGTGKREAFGSLYGPNAEHIGGVWKVDNDAQGAHATGIFKGDR